MIRLGLCIFFGEDHRGEASFSSHYEYVLSTSLIIVDVYFDHLTEVVFFRFLHCKFTFSPISIMYVFGRKSPCKGHIYKVGSYFLLLWGWSATTNYLKSFCMGDVSILFLLFIYLIIYWNQYTLMGIYFGSYKYLFIFIENLIDI